MAEGNWIKLYRKMVDDPIFVNSTGPQVKVLLTVMFLAAWTPKKWDVLGHEFTIQPGEVFISYRDLADRAGEDVSLEVVRKALSRFEKLGFWTLQRTRIGTLIHIVNWGKYQLHDEKWNTPENTPRTHQEHTKNTPRTHREHTKNTPRTHREHTKNTAIKKKVRIVRM